MDSTIYISYNIIVIIIDRFTKYIRFILFKTIIIVEQLAFLLLRTVFCKNGIPEKLILDRDKLFVSKFIGGLTNILRTKQVILTFFHP